MASRKVNTPKRKPKDSKGTEPAHPSPPHRAPGQRPADDGDFGVSDPGLSVDPEELGRQFLSDATEQDNFESSAPRRVSGRGVPLSPLVSEATLQASGQETAVPESGALGGSAEVPGEPETEDFDLISSNELPTSLFDHPARHADEDLEEGEDQEQAEDAAAEGTHEPTVNADEEAVFERHAPPAEIDPEARARAMAEERAALRRSRDRSEPKADRGAWESNRRAGRNKPLHPHGPRR